MRILNKTNHSIIAQKAGVADTFLSRMVGLLNRSSLPQGEALVITRCKSIHMLFMRFAIDVLFVDNEDHVVGLVEGIKPFRLSPIFFKASYAIELAKGSIRDLNISLGDQITLET